MLELDCHLTQDGHVVVSHDENLLRQTGQDVTISSLKLQVGGQRSQGHVEAVALAKGQKLDYQHTSQIKGTLCTSFLSDTGTGER